jgi:hypothetical protein
MRSHTTIVAYTFIHEHEESSRLAIVPIGHARDPSGDDFMFIFYAYVYIHMCVCVFVCDLCDLCDDMN